MQRITDGLLERGGHRNARLADPDRPEPAAAAAAAERIRSPGDSNDVSGLCDRITAQLTRIDRSQSGLEEIQKGASIGAGVKPRSVE